jgi:hypothetical protein
MSTTTAVGQDVATLHALVVTTPFTGQSRAGFATMPYPIGFVLTVAMLGQTNVHAGQGPRHQNAVLIEVPAGTQAGEVLTEAQIAEYAAASAAKQALVPAQQVARDAQAKAAAKAAADHQAMLEGLPARVAALEAKVK